MRRLIVPCAVIGIFISVLLPLPAWLIDFLLVSNLVLAALLLVTALFTADPLGVSSLPSMLLLAALYRLALNISTTRMILSTGKGGEVIEAFGSVVVGGNVVIGLVLFLLITLIQFIVIAKGSERVAEVCARFTLDALPGKQMSIDADVRSGLIDFAEARRKRQELQIESRFYGALDGAMKFVKGDAVAGLVIASINIIGGFAVGVLLNGSDVGAAFRQYTLLSIGDGLLAQIPAVLNALAAGLIVTRVVREEGVPLAEELLEQLSQDGKVRVVVGVFTGIAAFLPGMPSLPFLVLSGVLLAGAVCRTPRASSPSPEQPCRFRPRVPPVLQLDLERSLAGVLFERGFSQQIQAFQQAVFDRYGLLLPPPRLNLRENAAGYELLMRGIRVAGADPAVPLDNAGDQILEELVRLAAERKDEFVDDIMTRKLLDHFEQDAPELAAAVVPGIVSVTQLTTLLRELIREDVPIRSFDVILQAIAEHGGKLQSERLLLEEVRIALRRVICAALIRNGGALRAFVLDPLMDLAFAKSEREGESLQLEHVRRLTAELSRAEQGEILLTSRAARKLVKESLELRDVRVAVLAHEELVGGVEVERIGCVGEIEEEYEVRDEPLAA